jgi:hypothetical protein
VVAVPRHTYKTTEKILGISKTAKKGLHMNSFERYYLLLYNNSSGKTNHLPSFDITLTLQKTRPQKQFFIAAGISLLHCYLAMIGEYTLAKPMPSKSRKDTQTLIGGI